MAFKVGAPVIWQGNDNDTLVPVMKMGVITRVGRDTVWLDNKHKAEDQVYAAFLYPDMPETRAFVQEQIDYIKAKKAEENRRMARLYEFNNELVRRGLK